MKRIFITLFTISLCVAFITTTLGTGKNFSNFINYISNLDFPNPLKQTLDSTYNWIEEFKSVRMNWNTDSVGKLLLSVMTYQWKLTYAIFQITLAPVKFITYIVEDLYLVVKYVYEFIV